MIIVNEKVKIFGKICLKEESNSQLRDPNADVLTTRQLNSIFVFFIITRIFQFYSDKLLVMAIQADNNWLVFSRGLACTVILSEKSGNIFRSIQTSIKHVYHI